MKSVVHECAREVSVECDSVHMADGCRKHAHLWMTLLSSSMPQCHFITLNNSLGSPTSLGAYMLALCTHLSLQGCRLSCWTPSPRQHMTWWL